MREVAKLWGNEKHFAKNEKCTVKILDVKPFESLSLQKHRKRKEEWYFLTSGWASFARTQNSELRTQKFKKGDILEIPKGSLHRLFSKGGRVEVLEISFGEFDENDIVRLEDKYGRL